LKDEYAKEKDFFGLPGECELDQAKTYEKEKVLANLVGINAFVDQLIKNKKPTVCTANSNFTAQSCTQSLLALQHRAQQQNSVGGIPVPAMPLLGALEPIEDEPEVEVNALLALLKQPKSPKPEPAVEILATKPSEFLGLTTTPGTTKPGTTTLGGITGPSPNTYSQDLLDFLEVSTPTVKGYADTLFSSLFPVPEVSEFDLTPDPSNPLNMSHPMVPTNNNAPSNLVPMSTVPQMPSNPSLVGLGSLIGANPNKPQGQQMNSMQIGNPQGNVMISNNPNDYNNFNKNYSNNNSMNQRNFNLNNNNRNFQQSNTNGNLQQNPMKQFGGFQQNSNLNANANRGGGGNRCLTLDLFGKEGLFGDDTQSSLVNSAEKPGAREMLDAAGGQINLMDLEETMDMTNEIGLFAEAVDNVEFEGSLEEGEVLIDSYENSANAKKSHRNGDFQAQPNEKLLQETMAKIKEQSGSAGQQISDEELKAKAQQFIQGKPRQHQAVNQGQGEMGQQNGPQHGFNQNSRGNTNGPNANYGGYNNNQRNYQNNNSNYNYSNNNNTNGGKSRDYHQRGADMQQRGNSNGPQGGYNNNNNYNNNNRNFNNNNRNWNNNNQTGQQQQNVQRNFVDRNNQTAQRNYNANNNTGNQTGQRNYNANYNNGNNRQWNNNGYGNRGARSND
jgi:hypothetical protein